MADTPSTRNLVACVMAVRQEHLLSILAYLGGHKRQVLVNYLASLKLENIDCIYYHLTYKRNHRSHTPSVSQDSLVGQILPNKQQYQHSQKGKQPFLPYSQIGSTLLSQQKVLWVIEVGSPVFAGQETLVF